MSEKMKMQSAGMVKKNLEIIQEFFPACITENISENGEIKKGIDFDILKQFLSSGIIEGTESFGFSWVGKKQAIIDANSPIRKTLRPQLTKSLDWDNTENIYIEGDNLLTRHIIQVMILFITIHLRFQQMIMRQKQELLMKMETVWPLILNQVEDFIQSGVL